MTHETASHSVAVIYFFFSLFSPEELLAMILSKAQETASSFAEQPITGAVVTVPAFFSQAERRTVELACDLAGIKLLQLMTDNAAVALNYGVFR